MTEHSAAQTGACRCGKARFRLTGRPLMRAYCHCLICQAFNEADRADITVFYGKDVALEDEGSVRFRVHQQPPLLRRGTCTQCGKPAIEELRIPLMPRVTLIPSSNIHDAAELPEPRLHIFYHRRKAEAADSLPKCSGFLSSQSHFALALVQAMWRSRRSGHGG